MIRTLAVPGASREGFLSRERLGAGKPSAAAFAERYPYPALYVVDITLGAPGEASESDATTQDGPRLMTMLGKGQNAFRYLHEVGFLVKRPGNPFPNFVSVGRASNNDLVVAVESVSKFHCYFTAESGRWSLTDYRSTNGTELNGRRLEPARPAPVTDGDRIRLGENVVALFLEPASLWRELGGPTR